MSDRQRHRMIELQRAYRRRPVTYAVDSDGDEIRTEKGQVTRWQFRSENHAGKRPRKREATRTKRQRGLLARHISRLFSIDKLEKSGHDPILHPDNPYVDICLRRKLRKLGKGRIITRGDSGKILVPGARKPEPKKNDGLIRRASGLFVPKRRRLA